MRSTKTAYILPVIGDMRPKVRLELVRASLDKLDLLCLILRVEGRVARQHDVKHHTKAPDVRLRQRS